jgi:hypothetical protein
MAASSHSKSTVTRTGIPAPRLGWQPFQLPQLHGLVRRPTATAPSAATPRPRQIPRPQRWLQLGASNRPDRWPAPFWQQFALLSFPLLPPAVSHRSACWPTRPVCRGSPLTPGSETGVEIKRQGYRALFPSERSFSVSAPGLPQ